MYGKGKDFQLPLGKERNGKGKDVAFLIVVCNPSI